MMGALQKRRDKFVFRIALLGHAVVAVGLAYWLLR